MAVAHKALAQNKPLIILKGGKSEVSRRADVTHSGSLAGAAEVIETAFRQSGIVQVHSLNELIDSSGRQSETDRHLQLRYVRRRVSRHRFPFASRRRAVDGGSGVRDGCVAQSRRAP